MRERETQPRLRAATYESVKQELDRILFETGRVASAAEIKASIGGGTDQVLAATARWETELAQRLKTAERIQGLPNEFAASVLKAYLVLEEQLKTQARADLDIYVRDADAKVATADARVALSQTQRDAAQRRADEMASERDALAERIQKLDAALNSTQERAAAAEARIDEYRTTVERTITQAESQVSATKAELAVTLTRYDEMERRLVKEIEQVKQERDREKKQLDLALASTRATLAETHDALAQRIGRIAALQETEHKLEQRIVMLQHDINTQREAAAEVRARADEWARQLEAQRAASEHERTQWRGEMESLRTTLTQSDQKIVALSAENTALQVAAAKTGRGKP